MGTEPAVVARSLPFRRRRPTPVTDALRRLDATVSPLVGIVKDVVQLTYGADDCRLSTVTCRVAPTGRTLGQETVDRGGSWHLGPERARAGALGEAVERYCGAFVPEELLVAGSAGELGDRVVDPDEFSLFHPRQHAKPGFPFEPFTASSRLRFVEGFSLRDGSPALLPAQLVFLRGQLAGEPTIGYSTSNGLACGPTLEEAILAALLEVVERDSIMLAWNAGLSLPLLDWSGDADLRRLERLYFAPAGIEYSVVDASSFHDVPVAVAVLHGPPWGAAELSVGAAAAATPQAAWLKALAEAFGVRRWRRDLGVLDPQFEVAEADEITSFDDHTFYYATPERARQARFLHASAERRAVSDVRPLGDTTALEQIEEIVQRLAARGVDAYAVDVTSPDVRSLGMWVARVVAPALYGLDVAHVARYLGGNRLYRLPFELGLRASPLRFEDVNPLPHPFP